MAEAHISQTTPCGAAKVVGWYPSQTEGNRLRRRWQGRALDESPQHVEFAGEGCLFRVTLRKVAGQWRVVQVYPHAG